MSRIVLVVMLLMAAGSAMAQQQREAEPKWVTGYYRICGSDEGFASLRAAASRAVEAKDVRIFEEWRHPHCYANTITLGLYKEVELARHSPAASWNYVYDPNSREEPCETRDPATGRKISIPCRSEIQFPKYYYAHLTRSNGEQITVLAEVFATELLAQWKEAQGRRR